MSRTQRSIVTVVVLALAGALALGPAVAKDKAPKPAPAAAAPAAPAAKIDINNATAADLEKLPGIGAATAKKIIANRPYAKAADLSKAGVNAKTLLKIEPQLAFGATAAPPPAPATATATTATPPAPRPATQRVPKPAVSAQVAPAAGSGQVWVNLDTKVFHREGTRWYGKTKNGAYMSESEALAKGYREAKQAGGKKQDQQ